MKNMSLLLLIGAMTLAWTNMILFDQENYEPQQGKMIGAKAPETKQRMERFIGEIINKGKIHLIDEMVADDYAAKSLGDESFRFEGREALKHGILEAHFNHPGFNLPLVEYIAYDNRMVIYWPGGDILEGGIPLSDSNAPIGNYGIAIFCFEDGLLKTTYFMRCTYSGFDRTPSVTEPFGESHPFKGRF